jgi:tetratricopeptide (TPR) repeat protein
MDARLTIAMAALSLTAAIATAAPYTPRSDAAVLAEVPPGTAHITALQITRTRLDVALPLAQFYITRSRATGDLRFLGYAEATLQPWSNQPAALVLHATILQSRHAFEASLQELNRVLALQPDNSQAWLTRATVLRVLGRYEQATTSCDRIADAAITTLCDASIRSLTGHLESAYDTLVSLPTQALSDAARTWRYSELGEMAERLGRDDAAERWFTDGLRLAPDDLYTRAAYADLLLRQGRNAEVLPLLADYRSMEPMLLRIALATRTDTAAQTLANAFSVEEQRGDAVHRREQARFLLDVAHQPAQALAVARGNWRTQREPDDILILLRAARAAHSPGDAAPALEFIRQHRLEDRRLGL